MQARNKQQGIALAPLLVGLVVLVVFATSTIKMGPYYLDYVNVKAMLNDMTEEPDLQGESVTSIKTTLGRRLNINQISYLSPDDFDVQRQDELINIYIEYEIQEHLFFNIDVVLSFDYEVDI